MNLFYESTSRKDNQGEAAARWAGNAQPRCYSTRRHDLQTAPGVVARNAARHFLKSDAAKRQELQHLGTRLAQLCINRKWPMQSTANPICEYENWKKIIIIKKA